MKSYLIVLLSAFGLTLVLTACLMPLLRRLKAGQYILGYVKEHKSKSGTPTMGGLAFITAIIIVAVIFYRFQNQTVNLTLITVAGFMLVGFLDDFLKIYRKENEGLKPYQKIIFQLAIAVIAAVYCYNSACAVRVFSERKLRKPYRRARRTCGRDKPCVPCVRWYNFSCGRKFLGKPLLYGRGRARGIFAVQRKQSGDIHGRYGLACVRGADCMRYRFFGIYAISAYNWNYFCLFGNIRYSAGNIL